MLKKGTRNPKKGMAKMAKAQTASLFVMATKSASSNEMSLFLNDMDKIKNELEETPETVHPVDKIACRAYTKDLSILKDDLEIFELAIGYFSIYYPGLRFEIYYPGEKDSSKSFQDGCPVSEELP